MQKQIFISITDKSVVVSKFLSLCCEEERLHEKSAAYLCALGLVNQTLGNKANAKEIVSVIFRDATVNEFDENLVAGYLITYLESEMIASKDALEKAWNAGENEGLGYDGHYDGEFEDFQDWFEQNFAQ